MSFEVDIGAIMIAAAFSLAMLLISPLCVESTEPENVLTPFQPTSIRSPHPCQEGQVGRFIVMGVMASPLPIASHATTGALYVACSDLVVYRTGNLGVKPERNIVLPRERKGGMYIIVHFDVEAIEVSWHEGGRSYKDEVVLPGWQPSRLTGWSYDSLRELGEGGHWIDPRPPMRRGRGVKRGEHKGE